MPELPDIELYIAALAGRIEGRSLRRAQVLSPFLLRSALPPFDDFSGRRVRSTRRLGKRIVIEFDADYWLILHLMVAGRLGWFDTWPPKPSRQTALLLEFDSGVLALTEAGTKKRASLFLAHGRNALAEHDPGGLEVLDANFDVFAEVFTRSNHTLKRALTDPRILSGIGNAYSDEILHRARLSPVALTQKLNHEQLESLFDAIRATLIEWTEALRDEQSGRFPRKVTAFRKGMAAHGRYGEPCPVCETAIQRIRYASNETNYCPRCQTGGKLLADRSLSRLLKKDWPRTIEELEQRKP